MEIFMTDQTELKRLEAARDAALAAAEAAWAAARAAEAEAARIAARAAWAAAKKELENDPAN